MLIAEESDRKRREKQKKGYPPNWGGSYLNSDASGSCREAAELPTRPLSPSGGPSRTIHVFDGSVHVEGRSGDVEPRFVFSFRAFRLLQGSVLCFDASGWSWSSEFWAMVIVCHGAVYCSPDGLSAHSVWCAARPTCRCRIASYGVLSAWRIAVVWCASLVLRGRKPVVSPLHGM